ncbi:MAG TPA: reverse transcriptase domain-containing protein [Clostridia bacterium]|nr:reverse transcriptase domain-containing protein [Clostridia bacterium]
MESLVDKLLKNEVWEEFLNYKTNNNLLTIKEKEYFKNYINEKKYIEIVRKIADSSYVFSNPTKHTINKIRTNKKRVIYTFNDDEMMILKVLSFLLLEKYNNSFADNCYSFRKNYCVKNAVRKIVNTTGISEMYGYKIDIQNYFNSVNIDKLLPVLKDLMLDDIQLYYLFESILSNDKTIFNGEIIFEKKGIMAGTPISAFLANLYLTELDNFFQEKNILYSRYSDDILIFTDKNSFETTTKLLEEKIQEKDLLINESKKEYILPGGNWSFLGFEYRNNQIDISNVAKEKIKGKIRRTARKIRRWMLKKDADSERAVKAMIRKFNKKFYDLKGDNTDLTWSRWYFPIITTQESLKEIDEYMQQYLRYIVTGKHNKKNYEKLSYDTMRNYGYKPLVSEFWRKS